jgi:hypothetical protein
VSYELTNESGVAFRTVTRPDGIAELSTIGLTDSQQTQSCQEIKADDIVVWKSRFEGNNTLGAKIVSVISIKVNVYPKHCSGKCTCAANTLETSFKKDMILTVIP